MAVTLRSVGESPGVASTPCLIVKPTGLTIGDLMIAQVLTRESSAGTPDPTPTPGGWTEIRQDGGSYIRIALFWKIADAADVAGSNFSFTVDDTGSSPANLGAISAWTGHDPVTPINAQNGSKNSPDVTITSPALTPSVPDCMILMLGGTSDDTTISGYAIATDNPPGWSEAYDKITASGGPANIAMGHAERPETTSTGLGAATASESKNNVGQLVAIAPAVAKGSSACCRMIAAGIM